METIYILATALLLDISFGEPPNAGHPVAWLGKLISLEMKLPPARSHTWQIVYGTTIVLGTTAVASALAFFLAAYLRTLAPWLYIFVCGLLLKLTFSMRGLIHSARKVRRFLMANQLPEARRSLGTLVSRDTTSLDDNQIVAATVSSVAENSNDSFIAPLFYFILFGLPGAVAYRVINTFDAMIGYRGRWEYLGKFAARLDDAANLIPARLSALIMVLAAALCRMSPGRAWQTLLRDHGKTESPNAGWPMSALAGALEVSLEKTGHYRLGDDLRALNHGTIDRALKLVCTTAVLWSAILIITGGVKIAIT
ncbi:MAG: cobalamin biosynthesis protein [Dehalococcoidales bacterium]|jgi:adenosylcobinamide-phosphate synthase